MDDKGLDSMDDPGDNCMDDQGLNDRAFDQNSRMTARVSMRAQQKLHKSQLFIMAPFRR